MVELTLTIPHKLFIQLKNRLGGKLYADATDLLLDKLACEWVEKIDEDREEYLFTKGNKIYLKLLAGGSKLWAIWNIPEDWPAKQLDDMTLQMIKNRIRRKIRLLSTRSSKRRWIKRIYEEFAYKILDKPEKFYLPYGCLCSEKNNEEILFAFVNGKIMIHIPDCEISYVRVGKYGVTVEDFEQAIKKARRFFREDKIMREIETKYEIKSTEFSSVKRKYKSLRKLLQENPERFIMAGDTRISSLCKAGWEFYNSCEAKEPPSKADNVKVLVYLLPKPRTRFRRVSKNYYTCYADGIGKIGTIKLPQGYCIENPYLVTDSRVLKYLKLSPQRLDVKFNEIPYYKWAVEQLLNSYKLPAPAEKIA